MLYKELLSYLPQYDRLFYETQEIIKAQATQLEDITEQSKEIRENLFVSTLTELLIEKWEIFLDIPVNRSKSLESRKGVIISKIRGNGHIGSKEIQNICKAFDNTQDIDVIYDGIGTIEIDLIKYYGITKYIMDIEKILRERLPAHLQIKYNLITILNMKYYIASTTQSNEYVTVYPWNLKEINLNTNVYIATKNAEERETTSIYPQKEVIV